MKYLLMIATAPFIVLSNASASHALAPEYKACHAGNVAACKRWRDRSCGDDANPAACDYYEAQKQERPRWMVWRTLPRQRGGILASVQMAIQIGSIRATSWSASRALPLPGLVPMWRQDAPGHDGQASRYRLRWTA